MSVGFARKRLGYNQMPTHEEVKKYAEKISGGLREKENESLVNKGHKILDEHEFSRVVLIGKDKKKMKIKKYEK